MRRQNYLVGFSYNVKTNASSAVSDHEAEYDSIETINAIKTAIEMLGCEVLLLEANDTIFTKLINRKPDIVFNIAEGTYGRGREAQIPAIMSFLGIPFTGSDETSMCLALDKALCKKLLISSKIKTPRYQLISNYRNKIKPKLKFPLIVKPNAEGSSKGIFENCICSDENQLFAVLKKLYLSYKQPLLMEEYIYGREFTVGIIGSGKGARAFEPMEIIFKNSGINNIYSFNVKQTNNTYVNFVCPARVDKKTSDALKQTALKIHNTLKCRDFSRVDFRLSRNNELYFIEINPLPGLTPNYSDYPMIAQSCGIEYNNLIKMILNSALIRYNMVPLP